MGQTALAVFLPLVPRRSIRNCPPGLSRRSVRRSHVLFCRDRRRRSSGWISDRFGYKSLIIVFSFLSFATIVAIPFLGSGLLLAGGFGALGASLWALRPVIVRQRWELLRRGFRATSWRSFTAPNMGVSFLAPVSAGLIRRCLWLTCRFACDRRLSIDRRGYHIAAAQAGAR